MAGVMSAGGEEGCLLPLYVCMYLQRLPQSLRTLLGEVEHGDLRTLTARADRLWASYRKQQQKIAFVEAEKEGVAAIRGQGSSASWQNQKKI
jgi:hypothetical protein